MNLFVSGDQRMNGRMNGVRDDQAVWNAPDGEAKIRWFDMLRDQEFYVRVVLKVIVEKIN